MYKQYKQLLNMHGLFKCYILVHVNDQNMAPVNIHIAKTTTQYAHIIHVLCIRTCSWPEYDSLCHFYPISSGICQKYLYILKYPKPSWRQYNYILLREGPLICALFKIRTMFGFNLTHPPTLQFEQRRLINAHAFQHNCISKGYTCAPV